MMNMSKGKNTLDQSRSVLRARVIAGISAGALLTAFAWVSEVAAQEKLVVIGHKVHQIVSTEGDGGDLGKQWTAKTGVEVEWQTLPTAPLHEKMFREASLRETTVGVAFLLNAQATPQRMKLFHPLNNLMASKPLEDIDDIFKGMRDAMTLDGQLYAVPFRHATSAIHYNSAIWKERGITKVPENFEEWVDIVKQTSFTRSDGSKVYGFIMPGGGPRIYPTLVGMSRAFDGDFITLDYKCKANEPGLVKALTILKDFYDNGGIAKEFLSFRAEETNTWLTTGRVANSLASFGRTRFYNNPENSKFPGEFKVLPVPSSRTVQDRFKVAPINTEFWAMTIPANYPNKDLAWDFIRHMASKESTLNAALNGNGPVRSSAYDSSAFQQKLPYAKHEQAALEFARVPLPPFNKASQAMDILAEEVEAVMIGLKQPQEAMDSTCRRVNPLLPKQ